MFVIQHTRESLTPIGDRLEFGYSYFQRTRRRQQPLVVTRQRYGLTLVAEEFH